MCQPGMNDLSEFSNLQIIEYMSHFDQSEAVVRRYSSK